ncbi:MAG: DUF3054 domain-containing protein [Anaerolineae bacterium]|nr:DUF3054 domain-containing protein [Anaerolineae bacterium]
MTKLNKTQWNASTQKLVALIVGDLLVILSFVWIGRSSHSLSLTDIAASLSTALPFVLGWFLIMPWFGIYNAEISDDTKKLIPRLILGWLIAGFVALNLRALFLGRPIITGILPTFAIVSMGYIGLVAIVWRLVSVWWMHRRQEKTGASA